MRSWRFASCAAVITISVGLTGCGRKAEKARSGTVPPGVLLPDWAPKNPSPEFLRAAKTLKPLPEELLQGMAGKSAEGKALFERYRKTFVAGYECFGTLSDGQLTRFRSAKQVRIPAKSLTSRQRAALDRWFETWRTAMKGGPPEFEGYLVALYKIGAKEDLSNVDAGFDAGAKRGHVVHISFWVTGPDGKLRDIGTGFAMD